MPGAPSMMGKAFRHTQFRDAHSPIGLHEAIIALTLDHRNSINIVKHKYQGLYYDIPIDKTVDIMMDMLCQMMYKGRMYLFQEGMKVRLIEAINEVLKGGETDENTIQRESNSDGADSGST